MTVLAAYKKARLINDTALIASIKKVFKDNEFQNRYFKYFGYASIDKPENDIPNVTVSFYSFHLMVILGWRSIFCLKGQFRTTNGFYG